MGLKTSGLSVKAKEKGTILLLKSYWTGIGGGAFWGKLKAGDKGKPGKTREAAHTTGRSAIV